MQISPKLWQDFPATCEAKATPLQSYWLTYKESLTQKFAELYGQEARFCLLREGLGPLVGEEAALLRCESEGWIRQSEWRYQEKVWMAARTVVCATTQQPALLNLATRPIGHLLFNHPDCQRVAMHYACLTPDQVEYAAIHTRPHPVETPVWARRSVFCYAGEPIVISEIFFNAFFEAMAARSLSC